VVTILRCTISDIDPNHYTSTTPRLLSSLRERIQSSADQRNPPELLLSLDDRDPQRVDAFIGWPDLQAPVPVTHWPIAENQQTEQQILAAYRDQVRQAAPQSPPLLIRPATKVCSERLPESSDFKLLTTIESYDFKLPTHFAEEKSPPQTGNEIAVETTSATQHSIDLLDAISDDSNDCEELLSLSHWQQRLEDYRRSPGVQTMQLRKLVLNRNPAGIAVWTEQRSSPIAELKYFGIHPAWRREGWGRYFLERLLNELKSRGSSEIELVVDSRNDSAIGLYVNVGFEHIDRKELWIGT